MTTINIYEGLHDDTIVKMIKEKMPVLEDPSEEFETIYAASIIEALSLEEVMWISIIHNIAESLAESALVDKVSVMVGIPIHKKKKKKVDLTSLWLSKYTKPSLRSVVKDMAATMQHKRDPDLMNPNIPLLYKLDHIDQRRSASDNAAYIVYESMVIAYITNTTELYLYLKSRDWTKYTHAINHVIISAYRRFLEAHNTGEKSTTELLHYYKQATEELQTMVDHKEEVIQEEKANVKALQEQVDELTELNAYKSLINKIGLGGWLDKNILVVGHSSRISDYREVVEKYGLNYRFIQAGGERNDSTKVQGSSAWADLIIFLASHSSHATLAEVYKAVSPDKVVISHTAGIVTFEKLLIENIFMGNCKKERVPSFEN